ncbi:fimbrial protein [Pseudomonas sp. O64]|uniref:fimbrial protein n=1 Tax=unclassified Pseudomonas TaxID=196821 RepID=UPI0021D9D45C|nr:fimbrial protein [Pseudomonas sp. YeP6b]UXZ19927.1 type 1 fimbrial protein [Pseudomonas sp. YeP6b]
MKPELILLALFVMKGSIGTALAATTGTLTFQGLIQPGTCNLAAGDVNRTIILDTVKVSDFDAVQSLAPKSFELTATCDSDVKNVTFTFSGTPVSGDSYRFVNTGKATGVSLWLQDSTPTTIRANGTDNRRTVTTVNGVALMALRASYFKADTVVTAGTFISTVTVNVTYN